MFLYAIRYQSWFLPKIRCKCLRFFVAKVQKHMEKPILLVAFDTLGRFFVNYNFSKNALFGGKIENAIIFQPETSFRTQIVDLENEDKKLPNSPRYRRLFSNAKIKLKIPDEGLSRFFNLRARSVASIRFFHKKAF